MQDQRTDQEQLRAERRQRLLAAGIDVYPARTKRTSTIAAVLAAWQEERSVGIAGRIRAIRIQGGSAFLRLEDETGQMQVFMQKKHVADFETLTSTLDLGDIIDVQGQTFVTKRGERTVDAQTVAWLAKALRPLPSAWHGLADVETRYRYRELDTLTNADVKRVFITRSKILSALRQYLEAAEFIEVETPMLHPIAGGATARPFTTHHNALDIDLFLRVAPELYLKRLIVGGLGRVFEIGRNFRNEGIDRDHNPEFTMMECYASYTDYQWLMDFTEKMLVHIVRTVTGGTTMSIGDQQIDVGQSFARRSYRQTILEATGINIDELDDHELRSMARAQGTDIPDDMSRPKMIDEIFKTHVRPHIIAPTFVYDYPLELSPLAKKQFDHQTYTERFQILLAGTELGNAFSELNDPVDQRERFEAQERLRAAGDDEAQPIDETYIRSLEYGMPPTSGLGIGIDRLTAIIANQRTLKDVILFPTLKPEQS